MSIRNLQTLRGALVLLSLSFISLFLSFTSIVQKFHFSPLIIAVILGTLFVNLFKYDTTDDNINAIYGFATKQILRFGIILYGFNLSFQDILHVGLQGSLMAILIVCFTLGIGIFLGRIMGIDKKLSILISAGSAICGAAAVLAVQSVIKASSSNSVVAVATVVIFGTLGMFLYPLMYSFGMYHLDGPTMGILIGSTLHEVAHVVGAGASIGELGAHNAVIVKMMRVLMLVPVVALFGFLRAHEKDKGAKNSIPWFALWFVVAVIFNSLVNIPKSILDMIKIFDTFLLTIAMTALGVKTHFKQLASVGGKPFFLAFILFLWLGVGGFTFITLLSS